jgi:hypothetical protein
MQKIRLLLLHHILEREYEREGPRLEYMPVTEEV